MTADTGTDQGLLAPPDRKKWWTIRRRYALGSALYLAVITITSLFHDVPVNSIQIVITGEWIAGGIIMTYIGGSVADDYFQGKLLK